MDGLLPAAAHGACLILSPGGALAFLGPGWWKLARHGALKRRCPLRGVRVRVPPRALDGGVCSQRVAHSI